MLRAPRSGQLLNLSYRLREMFCSLTELQWGYGCIAELYVYVVNKIYNYLVIDTFDLSSLYL